MTAKKYDWLVVGAGLTGTVIAERLASVLDKKVLVIDRRSHPAGNIFDGRDDDGILYHHYGPHIFHTNSEMVVSYLSRFTEWYDYEHRVRGMINGRLVPIPFNLISLQICFDAARAGRLQEALIRRYGYGAKVPILSMMKNTEGELRDLAQFVFDNVFFGYTLKQWGMPPEMLAPSVTARVPVHISYDDRYFNDSFQRMPVGGYTNMVKRILSHENIDVELGTDWASVRDSSFYKKIVFTGPIDEFFRCEFGALPYRSLDFVFQTYAQSRHQPVAQVNYPNEHAFTRITEMGHMTHEWEGKTKVAIEYPTAYTPGISLPYYPIPQDDNQNLYNRYRDFAAKEAPDVIFCGRLGNYQYYNMDQAVAKALTIFQKQICGVGEKISV
ncbi:UDP-galactopyranose mutase [Rhodovastum atsumiense]|uniref:UDP-galactopyranose mutase n=1 Tax=Rhodovastum atsumiense TaxID=504468 RepID=A0A5M6IUU6_9PROT|nr:UDP-galactopyranose mutase [Rhodovastum atsumiense]KAA5612083.1 UDP-galactopyranose mutase [Rhodovastum atsumiense]CAH2604043.1 UDP-galactopyranose mutase [Rhodovastum atsumiense]